jgi:hypothetical protein
MNVPTLTPSAARGARGSDMVFAALPFAAWLADAADSDRLRCNARAAALCGGASIACAGLDTLFRFGDDGDGRIGRHVAALFAGAPERRFEARLAQTPGHRFTFHVCPAGDPDAPMAVLLLAVPASATAAVPGDWWRRVGHDLRGPVTPVRMALQLLRSGRVRPENVMQTVELADRQLDRLLDEIDDVSGLLGVHADASAFQDVPVDLCTVVDKLAEKGSARLQCRKPAASVTVVGDPARLLQLFAWIVGCAAGPAPDATVRVELAAGATHATLRVCGTATLDDDQGLACVAGSTAGPANPDMKTLLMREIARHHGIAFDIVAGQDEIGVRLALAPPGTA